MGKIKVVLFLIVFLLAAAIVCTAVMDLAESREPVETPDPFMSVSPTPEVMGSLPPVESPAATEPVQTIAPATPEPTAVPTPTPTPEVTIAPVEELVPAGTVIGSGSFSSDTGLPINVRAVWTATVLDKNRVEVAVQVILDSYAIQMQESIKSVNVSVGEVYASTDAPAVEYDGKEQLHTVLGTTYHVLNLAEGETYGYPVAVEYHFGGTYSGEELPVIECGGFITLSHKSEG